MELQRWRKMPGRREEVGAARAAPAGATCDDAGEGGNGTEVADWEGTFLIAKEKGVVQRPKLMEWNERLSWRRFRRTIGVVSRGRSPSWDEPDRGGWDLEESDDPP